MNRDLERKIWGKLIGPRPSLLLPVRMKRARSRPRFAVYRSYSELTGKTDVFPLYFDRLTKTAINDGLLYLASLNFIIQTEEMAQWLYGN